MPTKLEIFYIIIGIIGIVILVSVFVIAMSFNPDTIQHSANDSELISIELTPTITTNFCQANGYYSATQWIIGDEHSGMYGRRVGYGYDKFKSDDLRVHVDCDGNAITLQSFSVIDVEQWLQSINIPLNKSHYNNNTYNAFCQQQNMNLKDVLGNSIVCYRSDDVTKEYTPQEIAKWYIQNG